MRYAFPRFDGELLAASFDVSVGEMAVTTIIVSPEGYSWRQWCPWREEAFE